MMTDMLRVIARMSGIFLMGKNRNHFIAPLTALGTLEQSPPDVSEN